MINKEVLNRIKVLIQDLKGYKKEYNFYLLTPKDLDNIKENIK